MWSCAHAIFYYRLDGPTYSVMEVDTLEAVEALARGEAMSVHYRG